MLKNILKPRTGGSVFSVYDQGGEEVSSAESVANVFNEYFCPVASSLDEAIPQLHRSPTSYMGPATVRSFFASHCSPDEVCGVIMSFATKGCGPREIPSFIYKQLFPELSPIIWTLFNESLSNSVFPSCLKCARIIPILKSGNLKYVNNYRPIYTLPFLSKIFEKLMYRRVNSFFTKENILSPHQFGFRSKFSTSDAILKFLDHAYCALNDIEYFSAIFLDFSKAFDTVNHEILLNKLDHLGIRGSMRDWFHSYLSDRSQCVAIKCC